MVSNRMRWFWWLPALSWAAFIFFLSARPANDLPKFDFPALDKIVHFVLFAVLALLLLLALRRSSGIRAWRAAMLAFALAALYGGSDEIHQLFTPSRSSDPMDFVADSAGASLAFVVTRLQRRQQPAPPP